MTSSKLDNLELVRQILTKHKSSRDNDWLLYEYVMNYYGISAYTPFHDVKCKVENKELPSLETITRARRKVQEEFKELHSSELVAKVRGQEIPTYIDIARYEFDK